MLYCCYFLVQILHQVEEEYAQHTAAMSVSAERLDPDSELIDVSKSQLNKLNPNKHCILLFFMLHNAICYLITFQYLFSPQLKN